MKYIEQYLEAGITVYCSEGTRDAFKFKNLSRPIIRRAGKAFMVGNFKIVAFEVEHDIPEPFGYVINHPNTGSILFLTDSYYSRFKFNGLSHIIVEANWCPTIVNDRTISGSLNSFAAKRLETSHMSIKTCMQLLEANDLSKVKNIMLIHLSDGNSNAKDFREQVIRLTGINTVVADKGTELNLNLKGF